MGSTTGWVVVFAQMTAKWPYTLQWDAPFTLKIATSHGGIWTPSNAWFPGPTHNGTILQLQQPLAIPGKNHKVQNVDIAVRFKISFDDKLHEVLCHKWLHECQPVAVMLPGNTAELLLWSPYVIGQTIYLFIYYEYRTKYTHTSTHKKRK